MKQRSPSYWERNLPPVSPSCPLPSQVDILVVGAGFMGRWLAYWIGRWHPQRNVVVIEADRFGYGASTRNAGFLTCGQISEYLDDMRQVGFEAVAEIFLDRRAGLSLVRAEFPDLKYDACASVDFDDIDEEKRSLASRLNMVAKEVVFEEREVCLAGHTKPRHFSAVDGGLDPFELLQELAKRSEARFIFNRRISYIGGGLAAVDGETLRYERAFVCTNAFASQLDSESLVHPGRGQVIVTTPVETSTAKVLGYLDRGYNYFRFIDGRLLLGGGRQLPSSQESDSGESTSEIATSEEIGAHLRNVAQRIIGHDDWKVEHHWAGIMGFVAGQHVGGSQRRSIDGQTEVMAGFGGMGVALTPVRARELARDL